MRPASDDSARDRQLEEALHAYLQAVDAGKAPDRALFLQQHPDYASELVAFFAEQDEVAQLAQGMAKPVAAAETATVAPGPATVAAPGMQLRYFGDYELVEEIARGGMGIVYKARQVTLNRPVALKMILAGQLASPTDVERFYAEASIAANLQHPNIVAIHEVGQHEGQHYFSMALVEGQSLAELIRDNTLPPERAARYVKIVAEAIQFAHDQGTLHRDLKPSNILIDAFDQPRITDFGLARRTDVDARLTASGAVLGTPSYMPPEQASGERGKVGPASDVYAMGAMLYELVTGRPPFRAATPIDTILMVLSTPPVAPRVLSPKIDRNLETIILKCLAKGPADRYATARDLAEDLQAYLDGRPIKARRVGRLERCRRWLRKHRRMLSLTAATAAVTALLVAGGILTWLHYHPGPDAGPTGRILLTTASGPLTAHPLDDEDKPLAQRFTVPTAEPQTVPAGGYSFRFTAPGRCSETYRTFVNTEVVAQGNVTLEERRLWEPISVDEGETAEAVHFGDHADMVLAGKEGIRRIDSTTGKQVWKQAWADLVAQVAQGPGRLSFAGARLAQSTVDLDGDGVPDFVWANTAPRGLPGFEVDQPSQEPPWALAVSGKNGKALWYYAANQSPPENGRPRSFPAFGVPSLAKGDDRAAIVMAYRTIDDIHVGDALQADKTIWVEAISARTGKQLWRSPVKQWKDGAPTFALEDRALAVRALHRGQRDIVAVVAEDTVATLDLKTGQVVYEKKELPKPVRSTPQFVDGNDPSVLLMVDDAYIFLSLRTGKELWRKPLPLPWRANTPWQGHQRPVIADLAGNGEQSVILLQRRGPEVQGLPQLAVEVIDAATGKPRWVHDCSSPALRSRYLLRVVLGPDIDGDGHREVFAACLGSRPGDLDTSSGALQVEALSGHDGHPLWAYQQPDPLGFHRLTRPSAPIGPLLWWQKDSDGWPLLVVSQPPSSASSATASDVIVLSASTGRLRHVLPELGDPGVADLNGDGIPDLYALRDGKLHSLAGGPPEPWRWMQGSWAPVRRRDGAAAELVTSWHNRWLLSISADDGLLQRRSDLGQLQATLPVADSSQADLDGDGTADLLLLGTDKPNTEWSVRAVSGRTGEELWRSNLRVPRDNFLDFQYVLCQDLDGDGRPEVVCVYSMNQGSSSERRKYTLAVLSGSDGQVRWKQQIIEDAVWHELPNPPRFAPGIGDLDGDGVKDVVVWAITPEGMHEARAFSGHDGHLLWSHRLDDPAEPDYFRKLRLRDTAAMAVVVGDLDGDGKPEVIVQRPDKAQSGAASCEVVVLEGRTGKKRWAQRTAAKPFDDTADPTPVLLAGPGGSRIAVLAVDPTSQNQAQIVMFDGNGKECGRAPAAIPERLSYFRWSASIRPLPANRLLVLGAGKLRLVQDGLENVRWTWNVPAGPSMIVDIAPKVKDQPETVAIQAGAQVYGLNADTGKIIWTCAGPGRCTHVLPTGGRLPYLLFEAVDPKNAANGNTVCRQALAK
jgi:outer membrane protein assembly factor BamB